jgi:succinate-semialdehyde dehydrogenase / glutarate-semialdehyde dehydrogenase
MRAELYINGEWRAASDGATLSVTDPATQEVLAEVSSASVDDVMEAVSVAHRAGLDWARRAPRHRAETLRGAFDLLTAHRQKIAKVIVQENGKCLRDALAEVDYAAEFFRWYSEEAVRAIGDVSRSPGGSNHIVVMYQPVGVSVLVTPWNFPAAMATRKIAPALAAGCAVILKPASATPLTALYIADLLGQAGVPPGVVNVVPSRNSGAVVKAMLHDPRVRKLSFTGSTEVGRTLLTQAADQVVNCSMELGGNAPFLVMSDADVNAAIQGALVAKMRNGGEACTAANRFYVHRSLCDVFSDGLATSMAGLKVGSGLRPDVDVGPLIDHRARETVHGLVQQAVSAGAELMTGGEPLPGAGFFYPPTVLRNVANGSRLLNEEIFGPVAPVVAFDTDDEAIELANDTEFGLVSYVYTQDLRRAMAVAERLEAGMVAVNRGLVSDPAAPFGGVKQSGLGREGAHDGMCEFMEKKYIAVEW